MPTASFHQAEGIRLLLVEDDEEDAELIAATLAGGPQPRFSISHVRTLAAALESLAQSEFDAVMIDLGLPDSQGLSTLAQVRAATNSAVIVHSGVEFEEMALAVDEDENLLWLAILRRGSTPPVAAGSWLANGR